MRMGGREEAWKGRFLSGCHVCRRRSAGAVQHADELLHRIYEM